MQQHGGRTITKKELTERIAEKTGLSRTQVRDVLQEFLDGITTELAGGNRIEFRGFGVFDTKVRAARTAQNPRTLDPVTVPEHRTVRFKPGSAMKTIVDGGPKAQAEIGAKPAAAAEPKAGVGTTTDGLGEPVGASSTEAS